MNEHTFSSIWDAIEDSPAEAASMKARATFLHAIQSMVESWDLTQAESAARLALTQPRLNDLLRGRIDRFSLDALMNIAASAGLKVEWRLTQDAA